MNVRSLPHLILFYRTSVKKAIKSDLEKWLNEYKLDSDSTSSLEKNLTKTLAQYPEFRNLFYYRIEKGIARKSSFWLWLANITYPPMNTLFLWADEIGPGLFIQHGFATVIAAKKIGKNCHINQQVTVGFTDKLHRPIIGNNVGILAGAKVLGDVVVGDNVKIGANAVVVKSVPANTTVVGVPAYIVRRNGKKLRRKVKLK